MRSRPLTKILLSVVAVWAAILWSDLARAIPMLPLDLSKAVPLDSKLLITVDDKEFRNFKLDVFTNPADIPNRSNPLLRLPETVDKDFFFQPRTPSDVLVHGISDGETHGLKFAGNFRSPNVPRGTDPLFTADVPSDLGEQVGESRQREIKHRIQISYDVRTTKPGIFINEVQQAYAVFNPQGSTRPTQQRSGSGAPFTTTIRDLRDLNKVLVKETDFASAIHAQFDRFTLPANVNSLRMEHELNTTITGGAIDPRSFFVIADLDVAFSQISSSFFQFSQAPELK